MVRSKETDFVKQQRSAIEAHLTEHVLGLGIAPSRQGSFYRQKPKDPEYLESYEQSQGDPVLYAILTAVQAARSEREAANQSGDTARIDASVLALDEIKELELQYRYPGDASAFEPEP